jgi:hypothetical protein
MDHSLDDSLIKVAEGSMSYIKDLVSQCRQVGIDASLDRCNRKS